MAETKKKHPGFLVAAAICFVIAFTAFSGLLLRFDLMGRAIFGVVWMVLGVVWLGSFFGAFFGAGGRPR